MIRKRPIVCLYEECDKIFKTKMWRDKHMLRCKNMTDGMDDQAQYAEVKARMAKRPTEDDAAFVGSQTERQTERVKIKLNVGDIILCSMACELGFYASRDGHSLMWAMNKLRENMEEINDGPLTNQPRSS